MAKLAVFDTTNEVTNNDRMLVALFIAFLIHIIIVLGIRFTEPDPPVQNSRSIDVILVNTPAKKAPKEAKFLAQDNQIGSGEKLRKPEPPAQRVVSQGNSIRKHADKLEQEEAEPKAKQKVITQQKAITKMVTEKHSENTHDTERHPKLTAEMVQQQIAQYGNEIRLKEQSADQNKICQFSQRPSICSRAIRKRLGTQSRTHGQYELSCYCGKKELFRYLDHGCRYQSGRQHLQYPCIAVIGLPGVG